jgi:hypothetical protein
MKRLSDTGKVINLYPANIVNRYTQSTRERLTNMITVLHHIAFSLLLRSFSTSVPFRPGIAPNRSINTVKGVFVPGRLWTD